MTHAEIFDDIYRTNFWGGSGGGSREEVAWPFADYATRLIDAGEIVDDVLDIGCGDGTVGRMIDLGTARYLGCDASQTVIEIAIAATSHRRRRYLAIDATTVQPPPADLVLLKEVTQHLSNADIRALMANLSRYPMVLHCSSLSTATHLCVDGDIETGKGYRSVRLADFGCKNVTPVLEWQAFGGSYQMELWRPGA